MPLVLTQNAETADGHAYEDRLGVQYEFPRRYLGPMNEGERFVYYRGRRGVPAGEEPNAYLGAGVIGPIRPGSNDRFIAEIVSFAPFPTPVPFKLKGEYLEDVPDRGGSATGVYFRGTSVREVSEAVFDRILGLSDSSLRPVAQADSRPASAPGSAYPAAERAREIDEAGMTVALGLARSRWPEAEVSRMAHNNPGFDLLVVTDQEEAYVEVKSTAGLVPSFFLSEGERLFAARNAQSYSLLVVTGVRPDDATAVRHRWRDGAIEGPDVFLRPRQWAGTLSVDDDRKP
jgi:hypothetical protein